MPEIETQTEVVEDNNESEDDDPKEVHREGRPGLTNEEKKKIGLTVLKYCGYAVLRAGVGFVAAPAVLGE